MPRDFSGPGGKRERLGLLRAKQAENFLKLEINYRKLLLALLYEAPDFEALDTMRLLLL